VHVRRAWWSVVSEEHVFVLADPSHAARLAAELEGVTVVDVSDDWHVIAVLGPRAETLMRTPALLPVGDLPAPGEVVERTLAGAEVVLIRESPQEFLVSVPPASADAVWRALREAGAPLGAASVGSEAHERFEIAAGIRRSRVDHSGW
jgi:glycine cleavage system aminomethyltransferase T